MTAIAGSVFTAAQFNTFVRDNLAETAPAKATTPGAYFAVSDTNQIAERIAGQASAIVNETTTSTSYTDLATPGPSVTLTTGPRALIFIHGSMENNTGGSARMAWDVTGASTIAAADARGIGVLGVATVNITTSGGHVEPNLTPGVNTFTCRYRVSAGTGTFTNRRIYVLPL